MRQPHGGHLRFPRTPQELFQPSFPRSGPIYWLTCRIFAPGQDQRVVRAALLVHVTFTFLCIEARRRLTALDRATWPLRGIVPRPRRPVEQAVLLWQWRQLNHNHRRRARQILRRTYKRYPWAAGLQNSIASPHGVGKDGQLAYDLDTRTWFGTVIGNLLGGGLPWFDVSNPKYLGGAVGAAVTPTIDETLQMNSATTALRNAGRGILFIPSRVYLIGASPVYPYLEFQNCNNFMIFAVGAKLQGPSSLPGSPTLFMVNFANNSNVFMYGGELYSPYSVTTWATVIMGSGTLSNMQIVRWWFHGDVATTSISYFLNMTPTANGGLQDLLNDYCRFESPGTSNAVPITGNLVRGARGWKVQNCTFANVNNPIAPDNTTQKDGLIYAGQYEYYATLTMFDEGPDIEDWDHITYGNNTQVMLVVPIGTTDIGGVLIDFGSGNGSMTGNDFQWNPIQFAPSAGHPCSDWTVTTNVINGGRSTGAVNGCIVLQNDPGAASTRLVFECNTCKGTFTGNVFQYGTGYTLVQVRDNPGINPLGILPASGIAAPAMPASGVASVPLPVDISLRLITGGAVTISAIAVGGTVITGLTQAINSTSGEITVKAAQTFTVTYAGGAPTLQAFAA